MRLESIVTFGASPALGRRNGQPGSDEPFVFQTIEGGVDGAERDGPRRDEFFDPGVDRDAIGVIPPCQDGCQDDVLEWTE